MPWCAVALSRPGKAVFVLHINEGFTEPVEPEIERFDDDDQLLDQDWDEQSSYSSSVREQFAPMASGEALYSRK